MKLRATILLLLVGWLLVSQDCQAALDFPGTTFADYAKAYDKSAEGARMMTFKELSNSGTFIGYIVGINAALSAVNSVPSTSRGNKKLYKLPDNAKAQQMFAVVSKYIKEHPDMLHFPASVIVVNALKDAFPP